MLKARLFLKNGRHRYQQTDRFVNDFLMWFVTGPRTYIKERRKRRQWVRFWIRKADGKGAYYLIINDLRLMNKEDFGRKSTKNHWQPFLYFDSV